MAMLEQTSLLAAEQRAIDRLIAVLAERLDEELLAVWLFGSRARGEPPREDSDVDLLIVVADGTDLRAVTELARREGGEKRGDPPLTLQTHVVEESWIRQRRRVEAFFMLEVDRDRVVLHERRPVAVDAVPATDRPDGMRERTREHLEEARDRLGRARRAQQYEDPKTAVSLSYYATFEAGRAALSEEDRFARTHHGTWHLLREQPVATGRLEGAVVEEAAKLHEQRIAVDYGKGPRPMADGAAAIAIAQRFLAEVERLLGATCRARPKRPARRHRHA